MLIFLVALSTMAGLVFVEWQSSVMSRRLRVRRETRPESRSVPRRRRH
jgi:hypothetical protein